MKKRYIVLIVLGALLAFLITAIKVAPSIARNYIEGHAQELIGRDIKVADISFSLTTFTLSIDSLMVYEQDGKTPFVGFDAFRINLDPTRLLAKEISVSEIYLKGLYAQVIQNGDQFNFTDILQKVAAADTAVVDSAVTDSTTEVAIDTVAAAQGDSAKTETLNISNSVTQALHGLSLAIDNITIEKSNIIYKDQKVGSKFKLVDFSLLIPAIYFSNKDTDIGLTLKFADGGDLNVKLLFNMETSDFNVILGLHNFSLAVANPYLKDFLTYKDFGGMLDVDLDVAGNVNAPIASDVKGTVSLGNIVLTETSGKTISLNKINVGIAKANLNDMDVKVDSVVVDGVNAHFDMYKKGNNFATLLKSNSNATFESDSAGTAVDMTDSITVADAPADSAAAQAAALAAKEEAKKDAKEPAKPLKFVLNKLMVKNTNFTANDMTLKKPFSFTVSNITVTGNNINFNTPCAVNVGANFPDGGSLSVKYKGALSDMSTMDAYISVKNLALKHFTPYSHHFTGYPISAGTLAFASDNKINKYDLDSKNTIDIYNIDVGDKDPNTDPEFTVPMKIGLYILKDKDDKIQFDIPVKGNLQDPEFSYGKIIWKTVMNLLIKVAVSPLKLVGNLASSGAGALGINMGKNDEVLIDPMNVSFESEQFEKAGKMVQAVTSDPKLKMVFVQSFNMKRTVDAFRTRKLKTDYYKAKTNKTSLNELDEREIIAIDDKDSLFTAYAKEHSKDLNRATLEKEIFAMADKRNQEMLKVLQQQKGVTKKNVQVITATRKDLVNYKGKPAYKVQLDVQ